MMFDTKGQRTVVKKKREPSSLIGLEVFVSIYESVPDNVKLQSDPEHGKVYRGTCIGSLVLGDGAEIRYLTIKLSRAILLSEGPSKTTRIEYLLARNRYVGECLADLRKRRELVVNFYFFPGISETMFRHKRHVRLKKQDILPHLIGIGIGDLGVDRPRPISRGSSLRTGH